MIRHSLNSNTRMGSCYISLFKFKSFDQFNTPQTASNFRHLLSCGTIAFNKKYQIRADVTEIVFENKFRQRFAKKYRYALPVEFLLRITIY